MAAGDAGGDRPADGDGFGALAAGFLHSLAGWDCVVLALVAGWLAASLVKGSRAIGAAAFLLTLLAGAVAGRLSPAVPPLQLVLAAIVLAAGSIVLVGSAGSAADAGSSSPLKKSWFAALLALGGFACGRVHGAEAPAGGAGALHVAGFVLGMSLLLGSGVILKMAMARTGSWISRAAGVALRDARLEDPRRQI